MTQLPMVPHRPTIQQIRTRLSSVNWEELPVPRNNKGRRGQLLELALGIPNSSALTDLADGELKSYTIGQSIALTQLKHCLPEIIDTSTPFEQSKLGIKLQQTLYVGFTKNGQYQGSALLNPNTSINHFTELAQDYNHICRTIRNTFVSGATLTTITGPNKLLQIRTKASKNKKGNYTPLVYNNHTLKNKYMAFYLCGRFGRTMFSTLSP